MDSNLELTCVKITEVKNVICIRLEYNKWTIDLDKLKN